MLLQFSSDSIGIILFLELEECKEPFRSVSMEAYMEWEMVITEVSRDEAARQHDELK